METVEDQWRNESRELLELVNRLQEENKRLTLQEDGKPIGSSSSKTTNEGEFIQLTGRGPQVHLIVYVGPFQVERAGLLKWKKSKQYSAKKSKARRMR